MIRPTCLNCHTELTVEKNDVPLIHFMNNDRKNGIDAVRFGDIWGCPTCKTKVMFGMGSQLHDNDIIDHEKFLKARPDFEEVKF